MIADKFADIFDYIKSEEKKYQTERIPLASNWRWNMYEHIDMSFSAKNSKFMTGDNDYGRPYNNLILPIVNVQYRTEGFDVKDIEPYVVNKDEYYKSALVRKYHVRWAQKNGIDSSIDESVASYVDYGLALIKNTGKRPEVVSLKDLAFCDQTNIMSGPICLKHQMSIEDLLDMKNKWDNIDLAIYNARFNQVDENGKTAQTPGKYVEVYELHGVFPDEWLGNDYRSEESGGYSRQMHIVTYYTDEETGNKNGLCLFKGKTKNIFKAIKRDEIPGRACGRGGIEELFDPQIWTNFSLIHMHQALEAASKVVLKTTDAKIAQNNNLRQLRHNQIISVSDGKDIGQLQLTTPNRTAFDNSVAKWEQVARTIGSASDPQLGLNPASGTPLGTTEIVTRQGEGIHEYRRGQLADFWAEIYRDWILPIFSRDLSQGDEWLEDFSVDEVKQIAENIAIAESNERAKETMMQGKLPTQEELDFVKQVAREEVVKGGKKRFVAIFKGEMKDLGVDVLFNVAGKQETLAENVSKLNNVFRTVFSNPQILQVPGMDDLFNEILESSGLSPINFSSLMAKQEPQPLEAEAQPLPEQPLVA